MSKSAPDTRDKLDSNKGLKKKPKPKLVTLGEIHTNFKDKSKRKYIPKETKGQAFKRIMGFSKSTLRAMRRSGISLPKTLEGSVMAIEYALEEYRLIKKRRRFAQKMVRQKKHSDSTAYKRSHSKSKGSKGSKPANKVTK